MGWARRQPGGLDNLVLDRAVFQPVLPSPGLRPARSGLLGFVRCAHLRGPLEARADWNSWLDECFEPSADMAPSVRTSMAHVETRWTHDKRACSSLDDLRRGGHAYSIAILLCRAPGARPGTLSALRLQPEPQRLRLPPRVRQPDSKVSGTSRAECEQMTRSRFRFFQTARWVTATAAAVSTAIWVLARLQSPVIPDSSPSAVNRLTFSLGNGRLVWAKRTQPPSVGQSLEDIAFRSTGRPDPGFFIPYSATLSGPVRMASVPLWPLPPGFVVLTALLWRCDRQRRIPAGHCQRCGYDLNMNVSGQCPECGRQIAGDVPIQSPASRQPGSSDPP